MHEHKLYDNHNLKISITLLGRYLFNLILKFYEAHTKGDKPVTVFLQTIAYLLT